MILCLDIGNTHILAGLFINQEIVLRLRYPSSQTVTSDLFGLFLKNALRENNFDPSKVKAISLCSVVPSIDYSINAACIKYFSITPLELKPGLKTGLNIKLSNPNELGADRIANAVAAVNKFPARNIIVVDFGTATTLCALTKNKEYLGGTIFPGLKVQMQALSQHAAKLSAVDILQPAQALGRSTETNIQSGLYFGHLGAVREIVTRLNQEVFSGEPAIVITTGGYGHMFEAQDIFHSHQPDLVLHGLKLILEKNSV
jgi:type III pantothenate kinase